ncbi:hypothetical protein VHEMI00356 [[Torrubiella] hemipterigena]|nr:hypothetical protein VHEMI00356 [[Torrubiella] hemipterigena]
MIPLLIFCWSVVLIGTGFMHNAGQLYASRILLGIFESGVFPCLALYLSTFYLPQEQALRVSYLFVAAALSGSFGGLFAYALLKMDGIAGIQGWRWLFIIEGCASVLVALVVYFVLPDNFETAQFLNEEDKKLMRIRAANNARYNGKPDFDWAQVKLAATDPKLYLSCWNQFMADIGSFSLSSFLPLIIKSFGYDTVKTQLFTIPVFFWASFAYIVVSYFSDKLQKRAFFMIPACVVTAIGFAVNLGVPESKSGILYFSTFLIAPGVYIIVGLNCAWLLNSHAPYYKRAMAVGMNQSIGNSAGLVVGQIFKTKKNGKYVMGLSACLAAVLLAIFGHIALYTYLKRRNKKRDNMTAEERAAEIAKGKIGDYHPDFRYAL